MLHSYSDAIQLFRMANDEQQLHLAVRNRDKEKIERLITSGVDINCMFYGWTPLQLAIQKGYEDEALLLIDRGCDVHLHDKNSASPFEDCLRKNLIKVLTKILNKGEDANTVLSNGEPPLCEAVKNDNKNVVSTLIKVGKCNVNIQGCNGESPLFTAAKCGYSDICHLLLDAGADSDFVLPSNQHTPLITAASNDNDDIIKVLLKHGCNVNHCDVMGKSALWHAYSNSNTDSMKLLLRAGADKNLPNSDGQTILDDAKDADDDDVIELLSKFSQSWT